MQNVFQCLKPVQPVVRTAASSQGAQIASGGAWLEVVVLRWTELDLRPGGKEAERRGAQENFVVEALERPVATSV